MKPGSRSLRVYQSLFSFSVSSPVGKNFKRRRWVDEWMNAYTERWIREMDRQVKLLNHYW